MIWSIFATVSVPFTHLRGPDTHAYRFHTISHEPVEALDEQEEAEHDHEGDVKIVAEDGECQQRFRDEDPCLVVQPLHQVLAAPR